MRADSEHGISNSSFCETLRVEVLLHLLLSVHLSISRIVDILERAYQYFLLIGLGVLRWGDGRGWEGHQLAYISEVKYSLSLLVLAEFSQC